MSSVSHVQETFETPNLDEDDKKASYMFLLLFEGDMHVRSPIIITDQVKTDKHIHADLNRLLFQVCRGERKKYGRNSTLLDSDHGGVHTQLRLLQTWSQTGDFHGLTSCMTSFLSSSCREIISSYCRQVRLLGLRLLGAISLGLGLEEDYIENVLGEQEQHMAVNYYPRCPEPELTYGLPKHTDPNALTILLMDPHVSGLQVLKDGAQWIAVDPRPNALVVNLGDQLQALSNGAYKSVWHRAVVNAARERLSVASFLCPCNSAVIGPAAKLVGDGDEPVYRNYTYDEYYKKFWSRNLDQDHCLELFAGQK